MYHYLRHTFVPPLSFHMGLQYGLPFVCMSIFDSVIYFTPCEPCFTLPHRSLPFTSRLTIHMTFMTHIVSKLCIFLPLKGMGINGFWSLLTPYGEVIQLPAWLPSKRLGVDISIILHQFGAVYKVELEAGNYTPILIQISSWVGGLIRNGARLVVVFDGMR